uniref:Apple domain-containing protein n=1 Tax=Chrysotila carterae TaxID=13221 RepID=A0A7S4C5W6_CHRCT
MSLAESVRCFDDPHYFDIFSCAEWTNFDCRHGGYGVDTTERITRLVESCPEACNDVEPRCPPPPLTPPELPSRCFDDPNYFDLFPCSEWRGFDCRAGGYGIETPERIAHLVRSCPEACADVERSCAPPSPPPPLPSPPPWMELPPRCTDDPAYIEDGLTCKDWEGYPCRRGSLLINTLIEVDRLVYSCPQACEDVQPLCFPPPLPPHPPLPPSLPCPPAPPPSSPSPMPPMMPTLFTMGANIVIWLTPGSHNSLGRRSGPQQGACRFDDKELRFSVETWGLREKDCRERCADNPDCTAYEFAAQKDYTRCEMFETPVMKTVPVPGHSCWVKAVLFG